MTIDKSQLNPVERELLDLLSNAVSILCYKGCVGPVSAIISRMEHLGGQDTRARSIKLTAMGLKADLCRETGSVDDLLTINRQAMELADVTDGAYYLFAAGLARGLMSKGDHAAALQVVARALSDGMASQRDEATMLDLLRVAQFADPTAAGDPTAFRNALREYAKAARGIEEREFEALWSSGFMATVDALLQAGPG